MSWFVLSLITIAGWGGADLFYKKGSDEDDKYSHLKTAVWVGLVMGICSIVLMFFAETPITPASLFVNAVKYSPASLCYIVSMIIGYAGMRYLEISIISPVQNASGALSTVMMFIYFMATGILTSFWDEFSILDVVGTLFIVTGVIALAFVEKKISKDSDPEMKSEATKKYRFGALALLFPLGYCLFDTVGTAADGIILDEQSGLGLGEIDVLVLYGLTFLLAGIVSWIYILIKTGKPYNPFTKHEFSGKGIAALFEEGGQVFYVFAMSDKPMLAAPLISAYCVVSMILSRIFLKEKLKTAQYICLFAVVAGIIVMGISEGLSY